MFQAIVHFHQTHVFAFDTLPTGVEIKEHLCEKEGVPVELITLSCNGVNVLDECCVESDGPIVIRAALSKGLCGGKGGFGAQLRALAKQKAYIKTVDFGACRDLSGRRLRHVNDEILLQKWKEAKDKGESFEADGETPTGIDLWYLSAPSWAEGVKVDKRKIFMKPRLKTSMCIDWKRARERRPAPDGAPAHWGCPRGRRCEFAHGVEELRGEAQTNLVNEKLQREQDERNKKRDDYMGVLYRANKQEEELEDLVMTGLRAAKKAKMSLQDTETAAVDDAAVDNHTEDAVDADATSDSVEDEVSMDYFTAVSGTVVVAKAAASISSTSGGSSSNTKKSARQHSVCPIIAGTSAFATVVVDGCHILPAKDAISSNTYYYEVELYSDGLMQLGWADQHFTSSLLSKSSSKSQQQGAGEAAPAAAKGAPAESETDAQAEDGVGDCAHSWGFDGYRQQKWHRGEGTAYGPQTGAIWKAGDVVGCLLELSTTTSTSTGATNKSAPTASSKKRKSAASNSSASMTAPSSEFVVSAKLSYSVNGVSYGSAFKCTFDSREAVEDLKFFPAVSLENEESVLLNVGNSAFKHCPSGSNSNGGGMVTSVWETITGVPLCESDIIAAEGALPASVPAVTQKVVETVENAVYKKDASAASATASTAATTTTPAEPIEYAAIVLEDEQYGDAVALEVLGLAHLKQELERRGLKTGGTLQERAQRLFCVRGLAPVQYDPKLLAKKK